MESLFDKEYENRQPLRKYEPLIRFDQDGNPQPHRPLDQSHVLQHPKVQEKVNLVPEGDRNNSKNPAESSNELKRPAPSVTQSEPAKKRQQQAPGKQQKLTAFFTKK